MKHQEMLMHLLNQKVWSIAKPLIQAKNVKQVLKKRKKTKLSIFSFLPIILIEKKQNKTKTKKTTQIPVIKRCLRRFRKWILYAEGG